MQLFERFVGLFGAESIDFVCMDREFGGRAWLDWLLEEQIDFRLRLKGTHVLTNTRGERVAGRRLFGGLAAGESVRLGTRRLWGREVAVSALRLGQPGQEDPFLIVVSRADTEPASPPARDALGDYALRWNIETLFGALKRRGFRLEDTRLRQPERLERLFGILALLFSWAHLIGQWVASITPLRRIARRAGRLACSVFRAGVDFLRETIANPFKNPSNKDFQQCLNFLSCA